MSSLNRRIQEEDEKEFCLKTSDFFRPPLKQVGNSVTDIKNHYMQNGVAVIPSRCNSYVTRVRDVFLSHLTRDSFLYKTNIITGDTIQKSAYVDHLQSLLVLMDSLSLVTGSSVSSKPDDVQCDILLAICGQPVIVLTLVDGDKDSKAVTLYNASIADGLTSTLCKFMDENFNLMSGVLCLEDIQTRDTFRTILATIAEDSAMFVPLSSFMAGPSKYEKIVTAFWAGVAETRSIISRNGRVDTDSLRFLTKDQCIILMENINKREVEVQFQRGTGATTLMVEVARRLARLDDTLLLCRSQEEKERLSSAYFNIKSLSDLPVTDLSKYGNIVDETGTVTGNIDGKFWRFTRYYTKSEKLQFSVDELELENANTEKLIHLFSFSDRQDKLTHLSQECETLKLIDIMIQTITPVFHLPSSLALDIKHSTSAERSRDHRLETEDFIHHVLDQLKLGIQERRDLFPVLTDMMKQIKSIIPRVQAKVRFLVLVTSGSSLKEETKKDVPSLDHRKLSKETELGQKPTSIPVRDITTEEKSQVQGKRPEVSQSTGDSVSEGKYSEATDDLEKRLETLEKEIHNMKLRLNELRKASDFGVEWEYSMDNLSEEMSKLRIQDVVTDIIGEDEFPVTSKKETKAKSSGDDSRVRKRDVRRCHVHQLRHLQYGALKHSEMLDVVREVITDDQSRLSSLRAQSDQLENVYGSPLYIIGEVESDRSGPVSCPPMSFNRDKVCGLLDVTEELELVNRKRSGRHHSDQFQEYRGTCSRLPIPPSPSALTAPRYWETHTRVEVKRQVSVWHIMEMGISEEGQVDTGGWVADQSRSRSVTVRGCRKHRGICTQVWEEGSQCGVCQTDTLANTPGTDGLLKYGLVLDIMRGKLAFLDLNRQRSLYKFDFKIREALRPMFGITQYSRDCDVTMTLVSGRDVVMDDAKSQLIAKALFTL